MCNRCSRSRGFFAQDERSAAAEGTGEGARAGGRGGGAPHRPIRAEWRRPHVMLARILVRGYRYSFSAFMGRTCRYFPTCSEYTEEAIERYGLWAGFWIGLARILRCHPWSASGWDPIPEELPRESRWYMPWRYGRWTGRHITLSH